MKKTIKIVSSLVVILSIALVFLFRTIPVGKLWNHYVVVYVPAEASDSEVLQSFEDANIKNVVALSEQYLPLNISEDSLEYAMYRINIDSDDNKYISERDSYFFDKSKTYRLYYIPKEYEHNIHKAVSILENKHIPAGLDSNATYPILFPVIVLMLTIAASFFSRKRYLFLALSAIPTLYVFCNPFFPVALSICLLILCLFFISNIWNRKGAVEYLKRFIFIPATFVASLLCGFSSSVKTGILFIVASIGVAGVYITFWWIEQAIRNRKSFIPVNIRPAKMVSICSSKSGPVFFIAGISVILLLGTFLLTSSGVISGFSAKVMLPSSSNVPSTSLPQLDDYYNWAWNVSTYPYKSLNSDIEKKDSVTIPTYNADQGLITEIDKVLNYDKDFEQEIYLDISNLQFNSIEKVMQSEGENFKGGYNSTSSYHIDLFGIIMIIMCYLILLFIYFSIIITRKGAKK